jgi:Domain of unknown function (DUF1906)
MSRSLRVATLAVLIGAWTFSTPAALAHFGNKVVHYRGYTIRVPGSWRVYDLSADPAVCVRFNRHAVYLGTPSAQQRCPAHAVGRTEAILVTPVSARGARSAGSGGSVGPGLPGTTTPGAQKEVVVRARGLTVSATWANHPAVVKQALGLRSIAAKPSAAAGGARAPRRARAANAVAHAAGVFTGLGFDVCSAPSTGQLSAWTSSPYRAVGVYLGGANMACAQPNLTASWVQAESAAGWHLIPTYVGLQAPVNSCGCAAIQPSHASAEGAAAAIDAVSQAQAVGIGKGNPIYFDMEAYSAGTSTVLAFLASWTSTLHAYGYLSGVYSSGASGIRDLVARVGTEYTEPDDIWIADWNGQQSVSDPYVPSSDWPSHQRLHQYSGGHDATYGGVTLNIDGNYLDGATAGASASFPDGTFVLVLSPQEGIYEIAGGAPLLVSSWGAVGGPHPVTVISQQQWASLPAVPANGTFLVTSTGKIYRVAGGAPLAIRSWSVFGGIQSYVQVDQWNIDNISNPGAHLNARPANGTVVEGLPSRTYWTFSAGRRERTAATSGAVAVDDAGLAAFRQVQCVVPRLRHMTLAQAARTLKQAQCRLGKVHRPRRVRRHHVLHVTTQSARTKARYPADWPVGATLA